MKRALRFARPSELEQRGREERASRRKSGVE
jgi:hypothetical protein